MPSVTFSPVLNAQASFVNGAINAGGLVNTYLAGTSTPAATYSDSGGTSLNANPIVIGSDGYLPGELWLVAGTAYKLVVTDSAAGNAKTYDNITAPLQGAGALTGITDLTTTGNTILGSTTGKTLNVGNGALVVDASGNTQAGVATTNTFNFAAGTLQSDGASNVRVGTNIGLGAASNSAPIHWYGASANQMILWANQYFNASQKYASNGFAGGIVFDKSTGVWTFSAAATGVTGGAVSNAYNYTINATGDCTFLGVGLVRSKASTTVRASTTTFADDPDLVVPLATNTRYQVECWFPCWGTTSGAAGLKIQMAYSGTSSNAAFSVTGVVQGTAYNSVVTLPLLTQQAPANLTTGTVPTLVDWLRVSGTITTTSAGNLSLQWAQLASNVNAINVGAGGWLTCTKAS